MQLRRAAAELKELWTLGNVYVDRAAPWTAIKTDKGRAADILRIALNLMRLYAIVGSPIIPDTCARLRQALRVEIGDAYWPKDAIPELASLAAGHLHLNWRLVAARPAVQEDQPRKKSPISPALRRRGRGRDGGISPSVIRGGRRVGPGTQERTGKGRSPAGACGREPSVLGGFCFSSPPRNDSVELSRIAGRFSTGWPRCLPKTPVSRQTGPLPSPTRPNPAILVRPPRLRQGSRCAFSAG